MKPEERDAAHLWDMLQSARDAKALLRGRTLAEYLGDRMRRLALERALELVGEAARRVSAVRQRAHPEIEWRAIIGLRNLLAHEYGAIDQERLYLTGRQSVPQLIEALEAILEEA
ncbi:MAG TPA: HepT-like ribonuclease domain-containing protein [Burkholderiales bacterium]|jgi:uncharacterized protein with HEPN domain|nr:HepT-like ribonuclease domain-containing protein [Burkholderiales bacterium]HEX2650290.1 HepT-like ribonuclease domain-containing protein [Burkholderiales bacterium]